MKYQKNKKLIIIAEAGVNHNQKKAYAFKLIKVAKKCGADYVKFQTFIPEFLTSSIAPKAKYQIKNMGSNENQLAMLKKLYLPYKWHYDLIRYCKKVNIKFLSSPFDIQSVRFLKKFKLDFIKIPSGEITNLPLLNEIRKSAKKAILSTGMSSLDEVKNAYKILNKSPLSAKKIFVLHCNTNYPTENRSVNMSALKVLKKTFGNNIGYSDHTKGNDASLLSIALGAKIIEKHITLDKNLKGPDHKASLNPEQFKNFVKKLRDAEKMLGIGIKKIDSSEKGNIKIIRKSVIAYKKIKKGEKFSNDNLTCKRPGNGISPMKFYKLLGKKSKKNYRYDSLISSIELKK